MSDDPFHNRTSDVAFEIRSKFGAKNVVRGPYRHEGNAKKAQRELPGEWDFVRVEECKIRCVDEQPPTPESEWCK